MEYKRVVELGFVWCEPDGEMSPNYPHEMIWYLRSLSDVKGGGRWSTLRALPTTWFIPPRLEVENIRITWFYDKNGMYL